MYTTKASLLLRVRERDDSPAWEEFVALYRPLLVRYARDRGLGTDDADDVAQRCLTTIIQKIRDFRYDPRHGRFRGWLRKMANDNVISLLRRRRERIAKSAEFERPQERELSPEDVWERIWLEEHLKYCMAQVRQQVQERTYEAFRRVAVDEQPVEDVCRMLGMTPNQVYVARSRVTRRLQEMMQEMLGHGE